MLIKKIFKGLLLEIVMVLIVYLLFWVYLNLTGITGMDGVGYIPLFASSLFVGTIAVILYSTKIIYKNTKMLFLSIPLLIIISSLLLSIFALFDNIISTNNQINSNNTTYNKITNNPNYKLVLKNENNADEKCYLYINTKIKKAAFFRTYIHKNKLVYALENGEINIVKANSLPENIIKIKDDFSNDINNLYFTYYSDGYTGTKNVESIIFENSDGIFNISCKYVYCDKYISNYRNLIESIK